MFGLVGRSTWKPSNNLKEFRDVSTDPATCYVKDLCLAILEDQFVSGCLVFRRYISEEKEVVFALKHGNRPFAGDFHRNQSVLMVSTSFNHADRCQAILRSIPKVYLSDLFDWSDHRWRRHRSSNFAKCTENLPLSIGVEMGSRSVGFPHLPAE